MARRRRLDRVVVSDGGAIIVQPALPDVDRHPWLIDQAEDELRGGGGAIELSAWDGDDELVAALRSRGYRPVGTFGHELNRRLAVDSLPWSW